MDGDEEDGIGNWMIGWMHEIMVEERIACPELDYPLSEARYASIEEWEAATGKVFFDVHQP
jgi:hypothetical protein